MKNRNETTDGTRRLFDHGQRKALKKEGRALLRDHYFRTVVIAFIAVFAAVGMFNSTLVDFFAPDDGGTTVNAFLLSIVRFYRPDFLVGTDAKTQVLQATLSWAANLILAPLTFPLYVAGALFKTGFHNQTQILFAIVLLLVYIALLVFLLLPLRVGTMAFFLRKARREEGGNVLLSSFSPYYKNILLVKVFQWLLETFFALTVVLYPYKHYQYRMVDYILVENPSLSPRNALRLSKELTRGHKFELFLFDCSFLPYKILSFVTLGLSDLLFLNPYQETVRAEAYLRLKESLLSKDLLYSLSYDLVFTRNKKGLILRRDVDYNCRYTVLDLILIFFITSFIGWCWEVLLHLVESGVFVNRGTLHGPYLPIYGFGGVLVLVFLKGTRGRPVVSFFLSIALCLTIEYFTAWGLEKFRHVQYWDYSNMPFNLQGRICLYGGLVFGFGCMMMIYVLGPFLYQLLSKVPKKVKLGLSIVLCAIILTDCVVSIFYPNTGPGISTPVSLLPYFGTRF